MNTRGSNEITITTIINEQEEHMIKAEITIGSCTGETSIAVEILEKGPRPGTVWVCALDGLKPFTKFSHGGPYQDDTTIVLIPSLRDVHIDTESNETRDQVLLSKIGLCDSDPKLPPPIPLDCFLEGMYEDRTCIE